MMIGQMVNELWLLSTTLCRGFLIDVFGPILPIYNVFVYLIARLYTKFGVDAVEIQKVADRNTPNTSEFFSRKLVLIKLKELSNCMIKTISTIHFENMWVRKISSTLKLAVINLSI